MNRKIKRILAITGGVLLGVVLAISISIYVLWGNEIKTILSVKQLTNANIENQDGAVYSMKVSGDYYFDEFLESGGASTDEELIDFVTQKIAKGIIPMNIETTEIACSSFTATAKDGDRLFARNYDFDRTNTVLVYTDPGKDRYASVSTVDLQFLGIDADKGVSGLMDKVLMLAAPYAPLDGINEAGLSCGIYMTYQGAEKDIPTDQKTEKPDLTSTTMLRMILDYASTVEEAIALVEKYDLHDSASTSYHYMIADANGNSAVLEWVNGTDKTDNDGSKRVLKIIRNTDEINIESTGSDKYQCVTNFILAPGYYEEDSEKGGLDRYTFLNEELAKTNGIVEDESAAMELLGKVGRRNWLVDGDFTRGLTVHSVVYNLTEKTIMWVDNEHYGEKEHTFEFSLNQ